MSWKLEKTLLSKKIQPQHIFTGVLGFLTLFLIFALDLNEHSASGYAVFEKKEYWKLFSSSFLHGDLDHLFHNAFFFTGLSIILTTYFGPWVFPVLSFFAGTLINLITLSFYDPQTSLVGVSGVVYFMASFWLTSFILIERRQPVKARLIYAIGMSLIFFFPETFRPQVSYIAHGVGFGLGIVFGMVYFGFNFKKIRARELWIETIQNEENPEEHNSIQGFLDNPQVKDPSGEGPFLN